MPPASCRGCLQIGAALSRPYYIESPRDPRRPSSRRPYLRFHSPPGLIPSVPAFSEDDCEHIIWALRDDADKYLKCRDLMLGSGGMFLLLQQLNK